MNSVHIQENDVTIFVLLISIMKFFSSAGQKDASSSLKVYINLSQNVIQLSN